MSFLSDYLTETIKRKSSQNDFLDYRYEEDYTNASQKGLSQEEAILVLRLTQSDNFSKEYLNLILDSLTHREKESLRASSLD